ncbi:MAG: GC-type dockerin domain-anchored protein [Planctomycetota bacterium]
MRTALGTLLATAPLACHAQHFADRVLDYSPAAGQFVTDPAFNDPDRALGPPGMGTPIEPGLDSLVTLGGFGGSITLAMPFTVFDDPRNRLGLDAIVFGNAFYVAGDPNRRFAEVGLIEIAPDANSNGLADDIFYPIAGSQGTTLPLPPELNGPVVEPPPGFPDGVEFVFGYADTTPTAALPAGADPASFFTIPDDPTTPGIDEDTAGGDAFDIRWAVLPGTLTRAEIDRFDFIRVTTAVDVPSGIFGEVSTEIDAVADAAPPCPADVNADGAVTDSDFFAWVTAFIAGDPVAEQNGDGLITDSDFFAWVTQFIDGCDPW